MSHRLNRRELLRNAALTGVGVYVSGQAPTTVSASPNEKLNIACVGLGNQGRANLELVQSQNIVALCESMTTERRCSERSSREPNGSRTFA